MNTDPLYPAVSAPALSSHKIAELTGQSHEKVLYDIREMLRELDIDVSSFSGFYLNEHKQRVGCFNLPEREATILMTGYSPEMWRRLYFRTKELEVAQLTPAIEPQVQSWSAEALRLAADQENARVAAEAKALQYSIADRDITVVVAEALGRRQSRRESLVPLGITERFNKLHAPASTQPMPAEREKTFTMGSIELAELLGESHDTLKRRIYSLVDLRKIAMPRVVGGIDIFGRFVEAEYLLVEGDCYEALLNITIGNADLVVARWHEIKSMRTEDARLKSVESPTRH